MSLFPMHWDYFDLINGRLIDEDGNDLNPNIRDFVSVDDAEQYLIDADIRGNVR